MFVGVKSPLTAAGINDEAMFVVVGVNADTAAGASTDAAGVNAEAAVVAAVAAGIVDAAVVTAGKVDVTAGLNKPLAVAAVVPAV
jgi:hypothetical protein